MQTLGYCHASPPQTDKTWSFHPSGWNLASSLLTVWLVSSLYLQRQAPGIFVPSNLRTSETQGRSIISWNNVVTRSNPFFTLKKKNNKIIKNGWTLKNGRWSSHSPVIPLTGWNLNKGSRLYKWRTNQQIRSYSPQV